jgi:arginyl-tRNA synthetase
MYRFKDQGKMSTRKGRAIFLEDVLNKSVEMVKEIIETKNPTLPNKDLVAEQVGVGAVIFNDLVNDRVKDVDFDWDKILDFEGDSGPYIQYTSVRCLSVIEKFQVQMGSDKMLLAFKNSSASQSKIVFPEQPEEIDLVSLLLSYEAMLTQAFEKFKPNVVANYLLDLAKAYNSFYNKHRILDQDNEALSAHRVLLTQHTQKVLSAGLAILNIQTPVKM